MKTPLMRQIVDRAGWTVLALHAAQIVLLGPTRVGGVVTDLLEIAAACMAMLACWQTARRARGTGRPFWMMFGAAMAAALCADVAWTWLQDVEGVHAATTVIWMRDLPLLRTLLLTVLVMRDPDSTRVGVTDWLDLVQVAVVYALGFLLVDYNTGAPLQAETVWLEMLPRMLILLIAAIRLGRWRTRPVTELDKGLLYYLAFYLFAEGFASWRLASDSLPTGTWVDLAWTLAPVGVSWWAVRWEQQAEVGETPVKSAAEMLLANAPFALMPLVAVLQAAQLREVYQTQRYALLATSFLCFAMRLGISELRQSRQLESLVTQDRRLRETHQELQVQTTLLEELFTSAPEAIAVLSGDGRIRRVNAEFIRLFGYEPNEIPGRTLRDLLSLAIPVIDARESNASFDTICRAKNGESIDVSILMSTVILPDGESITYWICRDIREKKRAEVQLLQSQKMEAVGRLAGGVAHDFNNLLTVINGYSDMLLRALPAEEATHGKVATIRKAGGQAAQLTQQLLAFGRKQVVQRRVLDLNHIIQESESMYVRLLGEDLQLTIDCAAHGSIVADPGQMNQIVINLLVNARDAMPRGGRIEIRTADTAKLRHDAFTGGESGCPVVLSVSDTGVGIDAAARSHIFEPFFTTKKLGEGTGLGLAMVYGILQQMGGSINFESERGHGTTFELCFPGVRTEAVRVEVPAPAPEPVSSVRRILLVEDQESVRDFISDVLTGAGYRVDTCSVAEESFAIAAKHGPDLLLTDVVLPDIDGPQLASQLKDSYPHLKVLFVSGYPGSFLEKRGVTDDDESVLLKPFTPEALLDKVQRAMSG